MLECAAATGIPAGVPETPAPETLRGARCPVGRVGPDPLPEMPWPARRTRCGRLSS
jgi:hypothetical protein